MRVCANLVAWGRDYSQRFLTCALPSLLAPGNLPALARAHQLDCRIYTTPEDWASLTQASLFKRLQALVPVRFVDIASLGVATEPLFLAWPDSKFKTMSCCHLDAIRQAEADRAGLLFLMPDNLYSDQALARVSQLIDEGLRAVLVSTFPVLESSFEPACQAQFPADGAGVRSLPAPALASLALAHGHPSNAGRSPGPDSFQVTSVLHWQVPGEGILAHAWHLHPLFVHPSQPTTGFFQSIDNDWLQQALGPDDPIQLIQDSDQLTCLEPLPEATAKLTRPQPYRFSPLRWALAAEGLFRSPRNHSWVRQPLRFHAGPMSSAWEPVLAEADRTLTALQAWLAWLDPAGWPHQPGQGPQGPDRAEAEALCRQLRQEALAFEQSPTAGPNPLYSWANLAKLHGALGQPEPALAALEQMIRCAAGNPHALARARSLAEALRGFPTRLFPEPA